MARSTASSSFPPATAALHIGPRDVDDIQDALTQLGRELPEGFLDAAWEPEGAWLEMPASDVLDIEGALRGREVSRELRNQIAQVRRSTFRLLCGG